MKVIELVSYEWGICGSEWSLCENAEYCCSEEEKQNRKPPDPEAKKRLKKWIKNTEIDIARDSFFTGLKIWYIIWMSTCGLEFG